MRSHVNLNKVGSRDKISSTQKNIIDGTTSISSNLNIYPIIKKTTLAIDEKKFHRWVLSNFLNQYISNISNIYNTNKNMSLAYQTKRDNKFSDSESDHIFSHFVFQLRPWFNLFFFSYVVIIHLI